uniref:diphosphomevalonate decarboxylase n=1 Tax=Streptomyces sp. WT6 TaxID=1486372 RepID=A0A023PXW8_9ACTN|nr:hypothetical protein wt6.18c [Streptomyces sp. WT6]
MITSTSVTAVAHPNIALVKYWGKRDENLILPCADSLSVTLDVYPTTTTVRLLPLASGDIVLINDKAAHGEQLNRVTAFLDLVRERAALPVSAAVSTHTTVPLGAGLASSAAGFAALARAASIAFGLGLDDRALSRLARRGSGSAARSVYGSYVQWYAGAADAPDPDTASYAEPVEGVTLGLALVVVLVDSGPKPISSREAMRRTQSTSPIYPRWLDRTHHQVRLLRRALVDGDLESVGRIAEDNALSMHATMESASPPVVYRTDASHQVLADVRRLRRGGEGVWATMDAGPNVKVLCSSSDASRISTELREMTGLRTFVACPGPGATVLRPEKSP